MGWTETAYYKKLTQKERREEIDKLFTWERFSVVKSAIKNNVYYAAVRSEETGDIFGTVVLLRSRCDCGCYWYGYKEISEDCGPLEYGCPVAILDLLTPTDNECALKWRQKCREKAGRPDISKLQEGTVIRFTLPYDVSAYKAGTEIKLEKVVKSISNNGGKIRRSYMWYDGWYRWPAKMIPDDFEIVA